MPCELCHKYGTNSVTKITLQFTPDRQPVYRDSKTDLLGRFFRQVTARGGCLRFPGDQTKTGGRQTIYHQIFLDGPPLPQARQDEKNHQYQAGDRAQCKQGEPSQLLGSDIRQRNSNHQLCRPCHQPDDAHPTCRTDQQARCDYCTNPVPRFELKANPLKCAGTKNDGSRAKRINFPGASLFAGAEKLKG